MSKEIVHPGVAQLDVGPVAHATRYRSVHDVPSKVYQHAAIIALVCMDPPLRSYDKGKTWRYGQLGATRAYRALTDAKLLRTDNPAGTQYRRAWPTDDLMEVAQVILEEKRDWMEWPTSAEWFDGMGRAPRPPLNIDAVPGMNTNLTRQDIEARQKGD